MMGIGVVPMDSRLYLGMIGMHGHANANRAMAEADLVILCGARVGDRAVSAPKQMAKKAKIIHIDIDPAEIGKNMTAHIPIVGDIRLVMRDFADKVENRVPQDWIHRVLQYKADYVPAGQPENGTGFVEPRSFVRALSRMMDDNAILVSDVGQNQIWAARNFNVKEGRFLTSGGLGTMGYALPAAIGAKLAKPHRQVLCLCGDGSFQMAMCELGTLCQNQVNVKIIIMQNDRLGMVKEIQGRLYGSRFIATTLEGGSPDFVKLAAAYGIDAAMADSNEQAEQLAKKMFASEKAFILVCRVNPDAPTI